MKQVRYILLAAFAVLFVGAQAAKKSTKSKKTAKTTKVAPCPLDSFCYAVGKANSNGLKNYLVQRKNMDTAYIADFMRGFEAQEMTPADKKYQAYLTGIEIRQQVNNQIVPAVEKQLTDADSTLTLDKALFVKGFSEGVVGGEGISMEQAEEMAQKQMAYYKELATERKYGSNRTEGEEFLKKNGKLKDVKTTKSGLQYKVLTQGEGEIPADTSYVQVNYEGKLLDGTVFDSSYKRKKPSTFRANQVIKGWTEALTMMPVGSKWEVYIPQELAYGSREAGKIPPYSMLTFTIELVKIGKDEPAAAKK
jgi:FKBP-type peptidyl-prolyl cis-trans isomerase FklB